MNARAVGSIKVLGCTVTAETITPAIASEFLKSNHKNRQLKPSRVARYSEAMRAGRWRAHSLNPIKIGKSGRLIDGQHRLQSIVDTGASMVMLVVRGVPEDVFTVEDTGGNRTGANTLEVMGLDRWDASTAATAIQLLIQYESSGMPGNSSRVSNDEVRAWLSAHPTLRESVAFVSSLPRTGVPMTHSKGMFLHYLFSCMDRPKADLLIRQLYTGEAVSGIWLAFRNMLQHRLVSREPVPLVNQLAGAIKLWNSMRRGRVMKHLGSCWLRVGESFPVVL